MSPDVNKPKFCQIEKWIFELLDHAEKRNRVGMKDVKNFLDRKQDGMSKLPEFQAVMKRLLKGDGSLVKLGEFYYKVKEAKSGRRRRMGRRRTIKRGRRRSGRKPSKTRTPAKRRKRRKSKKRKRT